MSRLKETLRADFEAFMEFDPDPPSLRRKLDVLTNPGFLAVAIYRVAAVCWHAKLLPVARLLFSLNIALFGCEISPRAQVGPGLVLPHPQGVAIGAGVRIGRGVRILHGVSAGTLGLPWDRDKDGWPVIGDGATIYWGAGLFGPVEIGERAIVGARVVLTKSVPPNIMVTVDQQLTFRDISDRDPRIAASAD